MSPNQGRFDLIEKIAREYRVDGVVDLTWQACQLYDVESFAIKDFVINTLGLPHAHILTDFSESDHGQIAVRLEAFLEMIAG